MKFKVVTYRNPNDFKFASWKYEMNAGGECVISGRLKSNGNMSKYQKVYRVN